MSNTQGSGSKSKSKSKKRCITPPPQKNWNDKLEKEIENKMIDFKDVSPDLQNRIRIVLRSEILAKLEALYDRDYFKTKAETYKADLDVWKKKYYDLKNPEVFRTQIENYD